MTSLTNVPGLIVGHAQDNRAITGVTVILPDAPVVMAVDVRGGGPGTRETDALRPHGLVQRVHGLVLSGGSVFGLAAADAVCCWLSQRGVGLPISVHPVPVVPCAILFDLANGGDKGWGETPPYHALALAACAAASRTPQRGRIGAGAGARAGSRPGGIGGASAPAGGYTVAALAAVNSFGEVYEGAPPAGEVSMPKAAIAGTNTTLVAVATDAPLDKVAAQQLAIMAQDGLARAIRPVHTPFDGDSVFAFSTAAAGLPPVDAQVLAVLGTLASDCVAAAVRDAL